MVQKPHTESHFRSCLVFLWIAVLECVGKEGGKRREENGRRKNSIC